MNTRAEDNRWPLFLVGLFVFHAAYNLLWAAHNLSSQGIDVDFHMLSAFEFYDGLVLTWSGDAEFFDKLSDSLFLFTWDIYYPGLAHLATSPFIWLFGRSVWALKAGMQVFLLVLMLATYGLGKEAGGRRVGFWSAALVSTCPMVFEASRQYNLDIPLSAFVALAMLLLIRSRGFTRLGVSVVLGLVVGLGMLVKGQILVFLGFPLLFAAVAKAWTFVQARRAARDEGQTFDRRPVWAFVWTLFLAGAVAVLIGAVHWSTKWAFLSTEFSAHSSNVELAGSGTFQGEMGGLQSYVWQAAYLVGHSAGPLLVSIACVGFVWMLGRRRTGTAVLFLLATIPPLLLFSILFVVKHGRYLMPILPMLAVVVSLFSWGDEGAWKRRLRVVLVAYQALLVLVLSFGGAAGLDVARLRDVGTGSRVPVFSLLPSTMYWDTFSPSDDQVACDALSGEVADAVAKRDVKRPPGPGPELFGILSPDSDVVPYRANLFMRFPLPAHVIMAFAPKNRAAFDELSRFRYLAVLCSDGCSGGAVAEGKGGTHRSHSAWAVGEVMKRMQGRFAAVQRFGNGCSTDVVLYERMNPEDVDDERRREEYRIGIPSRIMRKEGR